MLDEEAFAGSAEGREYISCINEGWADAGIEAGEEPDAARAAGRRTTAFYTGAPLED